MKPTFYKAKEVYTNREVQGNYVNLKARAFIISPFDDETSIKPINVYADSVEPTEISYSEKEIIEMLEAFKVTMEFAKKFGLPCDIIELFEDNKKK